VLSGIESERVGNPSGQMLIIVFHLTVTTVFNRPISRTVTPSTNHVSIHRTSNHHT
jgi:hypothetical protein